MNRKSALVCFLLGFGLAYSSAPALGANLPVKMNRHGDQIDILIGGKPFTTYYFDPAVAKSYLQPLRSAKGTVVTRSFPVKNEAPASKAHTPGFEPHQRPLYFAHGDIDGLDFWGEQVFQKYYGGQSKQAYGRMEFVKIDKMTSGPNSGTIVAEFKLISPSKRPIAEETQTFMFHGDDDSRTIDCQFVINATNGPVDFGDTKEGTFGIRVAPELNSPPGHMVDSKGKTGEKGIWGTRADWVDYYGTVNGEPVGIAVLDSPKSFRHPTYWHARGYGLFAANPFGISYFTNDLKNNGAYSIRGGSSLMFRYRVIIHHGDYKQAHIADAYHEYSNEQLGK